MRRERQKQKIPSVYYRRDTTIIRRGERIRKTQNKRKEEMEPKPGLPKNNSNKGAQIWMRTAEVHKHEMTQ